MEQRCGAHTSSVCEADVSQVLTRKRTELQRGSQCAFVCSLTYKAVRVLGAQAAAGTFTMAAVADVRPEASTVTLLCTHRLSHCAGSEKKRILKVWHTHAQPDSTTSMQTSSGTELEQKQIRGFSVLKVGQASL